MRSRLMSSTTFRIPRRACLPRPEHGRGKGSGVELDRDTFGLWTMREGKTVDIRFYPTSAEALEAMGLSGQDAHADS